MKNIFLIVFCLLVSTVWARRKEQTYPVLYYFGRGHATGRPET